MSQENLNPHQQNNNNNSSQQQQTTATTTFNNGTSDFLPSVLSNEHQQQNPSMSSTYPLNVTGKQDEHPIVSQTPRVAIINAAQSVSTKSETNINSNVHSPTNLAQVSTANMSNAATNNSSTIESSSSSINNNTNNKSSIVPESGDEDEEENVEVEHSPGGGRWSKRNQPVAQRDVPGIDKAYLAMDTENGYEVVWNEINISGGKKFKNTNNINKDESKIDAIFQRLIQLNHPNIVKFHHYWIDKNEKELRRIIFITEYMSSGSLKQFLRKAKKTNQSIKKQTWKRWSIQLLVALHYLHNSEHPIIHDDLSCDTIYIQHNGLIKIGSIAPDIVNNHVKTCVDISKSLKNMHYMAPETREIGYSSTVNEQANENENNLNSNVSSSTPSQTNPSVNSQPIATINLNKNTKTTAVDIYAFGIVALEMFNLEFGGNGDTHPVTPELIKQSIEALDEKQQDFIKKCLENDPKKRPTAKELLFDPLLFEVPSLRLIAAHQYINNQNETRETNTEINSFTRSPDYVIATTKHQEFKYSQLGSFFDANKYLEDVRNGIYPLTAFGLDRQLKKTTILPSTQLLQQQQQQQQQQQTQAQSNSVQAQSNNNTSINSDNIEKQQLQTTTNQLQDSSEPEFFASNQQSFESLSTSASNQDEKFHLQNNQHIKTSTNTENNSACHTINQASLNVSPYSDTSSTNLSGNTSINYLSSNSSTSSPSSTSPSQSLSNINIQHQHQAQPQQQQQQQQQQYISDQSNQQIHYQIESNNHFDPETVSELVFSTGSTNYSNQASSTNSSSAPTPTPQHQQNLIYQQQQTQSQQMHLQHLSNEINTKVLSASSASSLSSSTPPPPTMTNINISNQINEQQQQQQQHHAYHNGYTSANSGTQSPVLANATNSNANLSNGAVLQNLINKNLHGDLTNNNLVANENNNNATNVVLSSIEKRHAQNMIGDLTLIDKNNLNNYQLTLKITFDDKSARVLTSSINRNDTVIKLVDELISYGLVNELDKNSLYQTLTETWYKFDSLITDHQQQQQHQQQQTISDNAYISQNNSATLL